MKCNSLSLAVMHYRTRCGDMEEAEKILDMMEESYYSGQQQLAPSVVSYSTLMHG